MGEQDEPAGHWLMRTWT